MPNNKSNDYCNEEFPPQGCYKIADWKIRYISAQCFPPL